MWLGLILWWISVNGWIHKSEDFLDQLNNQEPLLTDACRADSSGELNLGGPCQGSTCTRLMRQVSDRPWS